jgi:hypothetical protein
MHSRIRVIAVPVLAAVVLLSISTVVLAQDRDHSGGFFLRLSAGGGFASTKIDDGNDELKFSGPSGDGNFAIGAIVSPNLALHATLFGWGISDPDVEFNNVEGTADGDLTLGAAGGGLTYYIMPANVYLSGSVGVGVISFDAGNITVESDPGIAADFTLGKEWWVGRNWGIGVAAAVGVHSIPDKDSDEKLSGASFALRFTATMN